MNGADSSRAWESVSAECMPGAVYLPRLQERLDRIMDLSAHAAHETTAGGVDARCHAEIRGARLSYVPRVTSQAVITEQYSIN